MPGEPELSAPRPPRAFGQPDHRLLPTVVACLVGALLLSLLLVPTAREHALLQGADSSEDTAHGLLEHLFRTSNYLPVSIREIARMRAQRGDLDGAIELLTDPENVAPDDPAALRALASYYKLAQRPQDRLRTLEQLKAVAPTPDTLHDLAGLYGDLGMASGQRATLRQLLQTPHARVDVADHLSLARLEAAADEPQTAAGILARVEAEQPQSLDAAAIALHMSVLRRIGQVDQALAVGRAWIGRDPERLPGAVALLAAALITDKHYEHAVRFLEPFAMSDNADPAVIAVWAQAKIDAGDPLQSLARLQHAHAAAVGNDASRGLHLRLALVMGAHEDALEMAQEFGFSQLSPRELANLSAAALGAHRIDFLQRLLLSNGDALATADPIVAARVHLALGDPESARHLARMADKLTDSDAGRALALARLHIDIGQPAMALAVVQRAWAQGQLRDDQLPETGRLFIALRAAAQARPDFERYRLERPSRGADEAWALTAAATGQRSELARWLDRETPKLASADFYRDLTQLAMDAKAFALATTAGSHLLAVRSTEDDRLLMVHALLGAGQAPRALMLLRSMPRAQTELQAVYLAALMAAWRQGQPVLGELRQRWAERLAAARQPLERDQALAALIELRAFDAVLPTLSALATEDPQRWLGAFAEAAQRAGQQPLLRSVWLRVGDNAATPAATKEQVAFRLLESGDKAAAERLMRRVAQDAAHDSPAVQRLLYIWGPRPSVAQLDWLEDRARQAPVTEQALWMRDLIRVGAPTRAIALYGSSERPPTAVAARAAYLDALLAADDKPSLAQALRVDLNSAGRAATAPAEWWRWAQLAEHLRERSLQRQALRGLIEAGGADPADLRTLGMLAYEARDDSEAERSLTAFSQVAAFPDADIEIVLGELSRRRHDSAGERLHYRRALTALEAAGNGSFERRAAKARLLQKLDRNAEAVLLYEALLAERSDDTPLRADYVALLLGLGRVDQARAALSTTSAREPSDRAPRASAADAAKLIGMRPE